MTTDILARLEDQAGGASDDGRAKTKLPLKTLVEWFYQDCEARNLSPKTIRFYRQKLIYLIEAAGDRPAESLTTGQLRLIVQHYHETRDWNVGNTNHAIVSLKVFFSFLVQEGILDANPAARLEKLKGESRIPAPFTPDEVRALFTACGTTGFVSARDKLMLAILFDTGVRLGELVGLTVDDVDLRLLQLRVFGKGRKERMVPISPPVRRALLKYLTLREAFDARDTALWLNDEGTPLAEWAFVNQFYRLARRAKVEGAHVHRCRHTFANLYLQQGGNPAMLQRLLGHSTPAMTNRYAHNAALDARQDHRLASPLNELLGPRWRG